jgi:hypothetical protein
LVSYLNEILTLEKMLKSYRSQPFKYYVAIVTCFGMLMCTFLAAGPTVALVQIAMDFAGGANTDLAAVIP